MDVIRTASFVRAWYDVDPAAAAEIIETVNFTAGDRVKVSFDPKAQHFHMEGRRRDVEDTAAAISKEILKGINAEKKRYDIPPEHRKFKVPRFGHMRPAPIKWTRNPEMMIVDTGEMEDIEEYTKVWEWKSNTVTYNKLIDLSGLYPMQMERSLDCKIELKREDCSVTVKAKSDFVLHEIQDIFSRLSESFGFNWKPKTVHVLYPLTKRQYKLRFAAISKQSQTAGKTTMMPDRSLEERLDKLYTVRLLEFDPTTGQYERNQYSVDPVPTACLTSQPRDWIGFSFKEWGIENAPTNIVPKVPSQVDDHAEALTYALAKFVLNEDRGRNPSAYSGQTGRRVKERKGKEGDTSTSIVQDSTRVTSPDLNDGPRLVPLGGKLDSLPSVLDRTELWVNEPGIWGPARPAPSPQPARAPVDSSQPTVAALQPSKIDQESGAFQLGSKPVEIIDMEETRPVTTRKLKARKKKAAPSESAQDDAMTEVETRTVISGISNQKAGLQKYHASESEVVDHNRKRVRNCIGNGLKMARLCKLDVKLSLEFGRVAMEIPKKATKKDFPWTEFDNTMESLRDEMKSYYTDRITKEHYDAEFLTDLKLAKFGKIFSGLISQRATYVFHGTFYGDPCSIHIDAETFETQIFGPEQTFAAAYCHFPTHSWDAAVYLRGRQVLDKELPELSHFLQRVYIQPGKDPIVTFNQESDSKLLIKAVVLQRETRHIVVQDDLMGGKEIQLRVVENTNLHVGEHNANPSLKRADGRKREELRAKRCLWYSFSLSPTPENDTLALLRDRRLGDPAPWEPSEILGFAGNNELVERLMATASEVISRIDGLGCPREEVEG